MNKKYLIIFIIILILLCIGIYFFAIKKQNFTLNKDTKHIKGKNGNNGNNKLSQLRKLRQIEHNKKRLNSLLRAAYVNEEKQVDKENVQDTLIGNNYFLPDVNFSSLIFPQNNNNKIFKDQIYVLKNSDSDSGETLVNTFTNDNPLIQRVDLADMENSFSFKTDINDIISSLGNKISLEEKMPTKVVNVKKTLNDILNNNTQPDVLLNNYNNNFCGLQFDTNKKTFGIYMLNELYSNENNINPIFLDELVQLVNSKPLEIGKGLEKDNKNSDGTWNNIEKDPGNPSKAKSNNIHVNEEYFNDFINFMKKWGSHVISDVTFGKSVSIWEVFNKDLPQQYNIDYKKRIDLCKENCSKFHNKDKCLENTKETFEYFSNTPYPNYSTPTPYPGYSTPTPIPYYANFSINDIVDGLTPELLKNPDLKPINYKNTTDPIELQFIPQECKVNNWNNWSNCDKDCGGGTQKRQRSITQDQKFGGNECPQLSEIKDCNTQHCPINCEVGKWSEWSECSAKCGGGKQSRARTITQEAKYGGNECPPLSETQDCNTQPCPINCEVGKWSEWSECSAKCGGGKQSRARTITQEAKYGGNECPPLSETQDCNTQPCPINCEVGKWSEWGNCSEDCDGGTQTRTRQITTDTAYGGETCPPLSETQVCNTQPCVVCDSNFCKNTDYSIPYGSYCLKENCMYPYIINENNGNITCQLNLDDTSKNLLNKDMDYIKKLFKIKQAMYIKNSTDISSFPQNEVEDAKNIPTMKTISIFGGLENQRKDIVTIENSQISVDSEKLMSFITNTDNDKPLKYEYKPIWILLKELYSSDCLSNNINQKYIYNLQSLSSTCTGIVSDSRYIEEMKNKYINLFANRNLPVEIKFETSRIAIDSLKQYDTKYLDIEKFSLPTSDNQKYKLGNVSVPLKCNKLLISSNFKLKNESYFGNGYNIKLLMDKLKLGTENHFSNYIQTKDLNFILTFGITTEKIEDMKVSMIILDINNNPVELNFNVNSLKDPNVYYNIFLRNSNSDGQNNIELDIKFSLNIPIKDNETYLQYFEGKFVLYKDKILLLGPEQLFGNKVTNRQFYIPNNLTQIKNFSGNTTNGNINIGKVLNAGKFRSLRVRGIINKYNTQYTDTKIYIRVGEDFTKEINLTPKANYLQNGDIISLVNKDKNKNNQDIIVKLSSTNTIIGTETSSVENNQKWIIRSNNNSDVINDEDIINIYSYDRGLQLLSNCNNPDKYPKEFRDCSGCEDNNNSCDPSSETYCSSDKKCYKKCRQNYHSEKGNTSPECSTNCVSDDNPLEIGFLGTKSDTKWKIRKINKNGDNKIKKDELVMLISQNSKCGNDYSYLTSNIGESNVTVSKYFQKEEIPKIIPEKFWAITAVAGGDHGCWWNNAANYLKDGWVACGTNIPTKPGLTNGPGDLNHDIRGPDAGLYVKYELVDINSTKPILTGISTGNSNPDGIGRCGANVVQFIGGCTYGHPANAGIVSQTHGTKGACSHYQACCVYYTPANQARTYINSIAISETRNNGVILNLQVVLPDSPQVFTLSNNGSTEDMHKSCGDDYALYIVYSTNSIVKKAPDAIDFSSEGYTYVKKGCFTDKEPRAVPNARGKVNNVQECANIAKQLNQNVFALQYGGNCFTGDSVSEATKYGQLMYDKCIIDRTELGGGWTNIVYEKKENEVNKRISDWKFDIFEEREFYLSIDIDTSVNLNEQDDIKISSSAQNFTLSNLDIDVEVYSPSFISWNSKEYFSHPLWFELTRQSLFSYTFSTNSEISLDTGASIYINSNELIKYFPDKNISEFSPLPIFSIDNYNIEFWGYASSADDRTYDIYNKFCKYEDNKRALALPPKRSIIQTGENGIMMPSITVDGKEYYDVIYTDETDDQNPKNVIEVFVPRNAISIAHDSCKLLQAAYNLEAAYIFSSKEFCPYTKNDKYGDIQKIVPVYLEGHNIISYGCWNKASGCQTDADCSGITTDEHINHTDRSYGRGAGWIPDVHCPNRNCSNQQGIGFASWCDNSPTVPWDLNICSSDKDCGEDGEQWGGFCYPKCRDGYDNFGCCICQRMAGVDDKEYDRVKYCNQEQGLFHEVNSSPILGNSNTYRTLLSKPQNINADGTGADGQYSCAADNARVNNKNEVIRNVAQVGAKGAPCKCQNPYTIPGKSHEPSNAVSNILPDRLIWKQV